MVNRKKKETAVMQQSLLYKQLFSLLDQNHSFGLAKAAYGYV
jgi:hypothetical protein